MMNTESMISLQFIDFSFKCVAESLQATTHTRNRKLHPRQLYEWSTSDLEKGFLLVLQAQEQRPPHLLRPDWVQLPPRDVFSLQSRMMAPGLVQPRLSLALLGSGPPAQPLPELRSQCRGDLFGV